MRSSIYRIALLALPMLGTVLCEEPASPTQDLNVNQLYSNANEAFQDLLNALPEESLHVALNSLTKFKDGVFESDRHGVEHVHHDNPPLATKLIVAAVQDLKKRQQPTNGTASATPPPQTSGQSDQPPPQTSQAPSEAPSQAPSQAPSEAPSQASSQAPSQAQSSDAPPVATSNPPASSAPAESAAIIPVQITTTNSAGQATVVSSAILSKATAFVPVEVTQTNAEGSTEVVTSSKPAVIFTATDSTGRAFVTTSAVNFAPTAGEVLTTTDEKGSTFLTTYTPDGGRVSSIVLITSIGSDGTPMVITSYTYVDPAAATVSNGQAPTGTNTAKPGLQTGAARKNIAMEMAAVGGAVAGAFVLFV